MAGAATTEEALGAVGVVQTGTLATGVVGVVAAASGVTTVDSEVVAAASGVALTVTMVTVEGVTTRVGGDHGVTAGAAGRDSPSYGNPHQVSWTHLFVLLLFLFFLLFFLFL